MTEVLSDVDKKKYEEKIKISDLDLPLSFTEDRHLKPIAGVTCVTQSWRMKERMKTVSVALVLCLNVGVDPPDIVKTVPCARLECWIDPTTLTPSKALERIGGALQVQYERWQPRARYKQSLDPTAEEVKKLCTSLRRNAKEERVLFHYNGHGVPKATTNGEIWVFNRTYTQYIPLSVYDLQTWMGSPSIYVYDCSNAGIIVDSFKQFALQHESEYQQAPEHARLLSTPPNFKNCIQLAACAANQILPMNPDLPADVFTSCLTTPIKLALRWFILQNTAKLVPSVTQDLLDKIPGQITDRRTMLGELNWIFTAITDTIAWNVLPRDLFQTLFRQDLLVASLFRNFLLAERIMRSCDCTPVSSPSLPETHLHPMWRSWDLSVDLCLSQLPRIVSREEQFKHLPFFEDQLTAFEVWLDGADSQKRNPPEQLPIVLQVLLSQVHRVRALDLLGKFLDLGPWAVNLALSVGIFPYVLKLLQSCAKELRPLLVFIWAKILAVDYTCQVDLVRDAGHKYFLSMLQDASISGESRTQAVFVLACIVDNYREGQEAALQGSLVSICLEQLNDPSPHLRQWIAICLGRLWDHYEKAKWTGVRDIAHEKLYSLLLDPCPEVRAAAVYALGTFINAVRQRSEHANNIDHSVAMTLVNTCSRDISCLVRKELINALQFIVLTFEHSFLSIAFKENSNSYMNEMNTTPTGMKRIGSRDRLRVNEDTVSSRLPRVNSSSSIYNLSHPSLNQVNSGSLGTLPSVGYGSVYMKIWSALTNLEMDPFPDVAQMCSTITKYIRNQVKEILNQRESERINSLSLPPSPKRGTYLSGESPPTIHSPGEMQRQTLPNRRRRPMPNTINEENDDKCYQLRQPPLVMTNYVSWSAKRFTESTKNSKGLDRESQRYHERDWRFTRNNNIRREAKEEQRLALTNKLEAQVFNTRTAVPPSIVQFHPFDQQIAVAGKDSFAIWDCGTGAKTLLCQNKSSRLPDSKITALEWVNAQDIAMLLVASNDGSLRLWNPITNVAGTREPKLISAWQAFPDVKAKLSEVVVTWEQWTQTVITAGDSRFIRFWDTERELGAFDIPSGTESAVTCMDSTFNSMMYERNASLYMDNINTGGCGDEGDYSLGYGPKRKGGDPRQGLVVVGYADGSVKVFDRRCPPIDARVIMWMEHMGTVLGVQMRDSNKIISGSSEGSIKTYDIRKSESVLTTTIMPQFRMSCIAVHRSADMYACGSVTQTISIYNLQGNPLNTIRFYDGFMGNRIGPVTCINFHPYKVSLATGTSDCSVLVCCLEGRR